MRNQEMNALAVQSGEINQKSERRSKIVTPPATENGQGSRHAGQSSTCRAREDPSHPRVQVRVSVKCLRLKPLCEAHIFTC